MEEYVHRVGRTGRAGRTGVAYTFITRKEKRLAGKLIDVLEKSEQVCVISSVVITSYSGKYFTYPFVCLIV